MTAPTIERNLVIPDISEAVEPEEPEYSHVGCWRCNGIKVGIDGYFRHNWPPMILTVCGLYMPKHKYIRGLDDPKLPLCPECKSQNELVKVTRKCPRCGTAAFTNVRSK